MQKGWGVISLYVDVPEVEKRNALIDSCLGGFDKSILPQHLEELPEEFVIESSLSDLGITNPDFETIGGSARLLQNVLYRNTDVAESVFELSPAAKNALENLRLDIGGDKRIAAIAQNIQSIIRRTKEVTPSLSITTDELVNLADVTSKETRPLVFEMLMTVANKSPENLDKTEYMDRALTIFGSSSWAGSYRDQFGQYEWNTFIMDYLQLPESRRLIQAASSLAYCMDKSPFLTGIIRERILKKGLDGDKVINAALDKRTLGSHYGFLEKFAAISLGIADDDPPQVRGLKNPQLETIILEDSIAFEKAIRNLYNGIARELENPMSRSVNPMIISQRVFRTFVNQFSTEQKSAIGLEIGMIKGNENWHILRGIRETGKSLGLDWEQVQSWDEVKQFISEREDRSILQVR